MSENPYASPTYSLAPPAVVEYDQFELADRLTRFAAASVDGVLLVGSILALSYLTGFFQRAALQQVSVLEQFGMSLLAMTVMLALNGYLLATRGQTIGKVLMKIQIVDFETGLRLPFFRVFVLRYLWLLPLIVLSAFFLGRIDDSLLKVAPWIDAMFIFGAAHRCLHDYIAGSKVVLFAWNRPLVG